MPELPEVQTVVNHIRPMIIGERLKKIKPVWNKVLHNFDGKVYQVLKKNEIIDVYRRAKFIIIAFEKHIIAIHLRMTGKLYVADKNFNSKYVTAIFEFESMRSLLFEDVRKFGRIYLYNDLSIINSTHGPEPLGINFTLQLFKKMLSQRKRNIKALLLDQSFLSGLGNIYVDESLWKSGIHPNSLANSIPQKRIEALHSNIISTLKEAIDKKGQTFSTEGSGFYARALQHEIDHLNGILFVDHLKPLKRQLMRNALKRLKKEGLKWQRENKQSIDK